MTAATPALPLQSTALPLQSVGITPIEASLFAFVLLAAVLTALFRDVLAAIVVFAAYSLGLALVYTFYRAPDVALTEAAIGAGITTVFFLVTIAKTSRPASEELFESINWPAVGVAGLFVLVVGATLPAIPAVGDPNSPILTNELVTGHYLTKGYKQTGAENIVTSVLAAYRGFDTFGEAIVVFAAGVGGLLVLGREVFTT